MIANGESGKTRNAHVTGETPKPLIKNGLTLETFDFMLTNDKEIARQLTLMDFERFQEIQSRECLNTVSLTIVRENVIRNAWWGVCPESALTISTQLR